VPSTSAPPGEVIEPGHVSALGGRIAVEHRVLARARHVDGERGEPGAQDEVGGAQAVLLPTVDASPVHDHRRPGDASRQLQVAGERPAVERQLDHGERRREVFRRFAEDAQRVPVGFKLARRARHRVATDAAIVEGERVELGELVGAGTGGRARVGRSLVAEPDLRPQPRPQVAVEARQRRAHLLGVGAADVLERIEAAGAAQHLRLDVVERAPERGRIRRRRDRGGRAGRGHADDLPADIERGDPSPSYSPKLPK
jgi:hypothetical protein